MHFSRTYNKRGKLELTNQCSHRLQLLKILLKTLGWKIKCKKPITTGMAAQEGNSRIYLAFGTSLFQAALQPHSSTHFHWEPRGCHDSNPGNPCGTTDSRTTKMSQSQARLSQNYPLLLNDLPHGPYSTEHRSHKRKLLQNQISFYLELAISSTYMQQNKHIHIHDASQL